MFRKLKPYLCDATKGLKKHDEKIAALGMSLGGNIVQRIATLFPKKITRVVTVCSPGIDQESCKRYETYVNTHRLAPSIIHCIEADDLVDEFEEHHLGAGCIGSHAKIEVIGLMPLTEDIPYAESVCTFSDHNYKWPIMRPYGKWYEALNKISHVYLSHPRTTTLASCKVFTLISTNVLHHSALNGWLKHESPYKDRHWEEWRKYITLRREVGFSQFIEENVVL